MFDWFDVLGVLTMVFFGVYTGGYLGREAGFTSGVPLLLCGLAGGAVAVFAIIIVARNRAKVNG